MFAEEVRGARVQQAIRSSTRNSTIYRVPTDNAELLASSTHLCTCMVTGMDGKNKCKVLDFKDQ